MRIKDRGSRWSPNVSPDKPEDLPRYLFNELTKLSKVLFQVDRLHLDRQYKVKDGDKPRDGDIELCDENVRGDSAGLYYYNGTDWIFIK